MCAILGFCGRTKRLQWKLVHHLLTELFKASAVRGGDAAGFAAILLTLLMAAKGYPKAFLWKAVGNVPYFVIMKVLRLPSTILLRRTKNKWVRTERAPQNAQGFPKEK